MNRLFLTAALAASALLAAAIPADPRPFRVAQPDGDSLTVTLNGDEFYNFYTTSDGYTVLPTQAGYVYARQQGNSLASTGIVAHDPARRQLSEAAAVTTLTRRAVDRNAIATGNLRRAQRDNRAPIGNINAQRAPRRIEGANFDYDNFKGLIILINYSDTKFVNDTQFYDDMVNKVGYKGFTHNGQRKSTYGSMHDYFTDQSNGMFSPYFDIYGPVDVDFTCTTPHGTDNCYEIFAEALTQLDDEVDFSQYDTDNDGYIDMVYFMVAGYSANYGGNNSGYLWPHAYYLVEWTQYGVIPFSLDNKYFWRYACSTEIYGWENYGYDTPLGIGTMCHEFSHVLGLPDLYDTDYATGGQSVHPGNWDVMAGGSGLDEGRTPVGYSIWERSTLGFATPTEITQPGNYTLHELQSTREGFILNTDHPGEYFTFENRQRNRWDIYLPGHGMLVARVDESNQSVWDDNSVNANPSHNYYELLHADGNDDITDGNSFPGSANKTKLTNLTLANLMSWYGTPSPLILQNIKESNSVITFDVTEDDSMHSAVEDFETMKITTTSTSTGLRGRFAKWNLTKCNVVEISDAKYGNDSRALAMVKPSVVQSTSEIDCDDIYRISAQVYVAGSSTAKFQLHTSTDNGKTWQDHGTETASSLKSTTLSWNVEIYEPVLIKITMTAGSTNASKPSYVDDITIHYSGEMRIPADPFDVNNDGNVDVGDVNTVLSAILAADNNTNFDVNHDGNVDVGDVNAILQAILGN